MESLKLLIPKLTTNTLFLIHVCTVNIKKINNGQGERILESLSLRKL